MGMQSRRKGKHGELEAAKELARLFGIEARRGQQFKGTPDSPDVIVGIPIYVEVKRCEKFHLYAALDQAEECAGDAIPLVLHRQNLREWTAVCYLRDLKRLCESLLGGSIKRAITTLANLTKVPEAEAARCVWEAIDDVWKATLNRVVVSLENQIEREA